MLRQEEEEIKDKTNQSNNYNDYNDFDFSNIFSTASLWLTGGTRPTLYLPIKLAKKYRIDKPCDDKTELNWNLNSSTLAVDYRLLS